MGERQAHMYLTFDDPRLLVLIYGYPRYLTSFFYMTWSSKDEGHNGNDLGWVGAKHLFFNFDELRFLVLIYGFFCMTLSKPV